MVHCKTVQIGTMAEFKEFVGNTLRKGRWIFRGQSDAEWGLSTSLDRAFAGTKPQRIGKRKAEAILVREFQRHAHRYLDDGVPDEDYLECLATMQHFRFPTRLLDWTCSEDVALLFAIYRRQSEKGAAVWAVNQSRLWERFAVTLSRIDRRAFRLVEEFDKDPEGPEQNIESTMANGHSSHLLIRSESMNDDTFSRAHFSFRLT